MPIRCPKWLKYKATGGFLRAKWQPEALRLDDSRAAKQLRRSLFATVQSWQRETYGVRMSLALRLKTYGAMGVLALQKPRSDIS